MSISHESGTQMMIDINTRAVNVEGLDRASGGPIIMLIRHASSISPVIS